MLAPWHWFWLFKKRKLSALSCLSTCMQHSPFPALVEMAQRPQAAEYAIFCWFAEVFCSLMMLQHKLTIKACQAVVSLEAVGWTKGSGQALTEHLPAVMYVVVKQQQRLNSEQYWMDQATLRMWCTHRCLQSQEHIITTG